MACLSLTLQKTFQRKCFNSQDGRGKTSYLGISAEGCQWKYEIQGASKKDLLVKQQSVPNTCDILPLKKIFFQNLTDAFSNISKVY